MDRIAPPHIRNAAISLACKISRAHVLAHALDFLAASPEEAKAIHERFRHFAGRSGFINVEGSARRFGLSGKIIWSATAVNNLGLVGELEDIRPIRIIGNSCREGAMEGYCVHAIQHILVRNGLARLFRLGARKIEGAGLDIKGLTPRLFAERLYPLVIELGLGHIMRLTGGLSGVSALSRAPVEMTFGERDRLEMMSKGFDRFLKERDLHFSGDFFETQDTGLAFASREFLLGQGIIEPGKPVWHKLTPKGQGFIKFLVTGFDTAGEPGLSKPALPK